MEGKNLFESLMVFGTIFSRSYEVAELRVKKLHFDLSDVIHANEHAIYANCGLRRPLEFFIDAILFYDANGSW